MINLLIQVYDVSGVMSQYDKVRVYSDPDPAGAFDTVLVDITLVGSQTTYEYNDETGVQTWYESSFLDSTDNTESNRSGPFEGLLQGGPDVFTQGPLGVLTIAYVKDMTTFSGLAVLPDPQIAELILRAEVLLENFAQKYGGWNTSYPNFQMVLRILARLLLEELYLRSSQTLRAANAGGLISEQMGAYSYKRGWPPVNQQLTYPASLMQYFSPEMQKLLYDLVTESPTRIFFSTTQVFRELVAKANEDGIYLRPHWDGWDREIYWNQMLYQFSAPQSLNHPTYLYAPYWRPWGWRAIAG